MRKKKEDVHNFREKKFPVVGIGASAGGLEAVTMLLKSLSPDTGMAFIYIQHLSASHESVLVEILSKVTKMKVVEAKDKMALKPNQVYIVPPDKDIISVNGSLTLANRKTTHYPIDEFFYSLAVTRREGAIGIILSGSATDGTRGLKAIKTEGGLTFAQDDSAKFTSMPKSAIAEGAVDFVLSPKEIAAELGRLSSHDYINGTIPKKDIEETITNNDVNLRSILTLVGKAKGVDFTHYKMNTIKRRILRRMILYKLETLADYLKLLKSKSTETDILYNDLLINVSGFFRDAPAYNFLKKSVLPRMLKKKLPGESLRLWIAACSSGEEAYTFAIILEEILESMAIKVPVQIFATDLNEQAIAKARIGEYSKNDLNVLTPKQIQRFFNKSDGNYRVIKSLRDMCVFAPHNIFRDPPFSKIDFVSCCNLFIYLTPLLQKKALATFHYALNDDGYLMLGKAETIGSYSQLFSNINKKFKIYANTKDKRPQAYFEHSFTPSPQIETGKKDHPEKAIFNNDPSDLDKKIDSVLLSSYVPPSIVINNKMEVLQFRGNTDLYLHHPPGKASLNILKLSIPELPYELRNAITKAIKTKQTVRKNGIEVNRRELLYLVNIEILPLKTEWHEPLFLIIFNDERQAINIAQNQASEKNISAASARRIKKLEEELTAVRTDMRASIENQETTNEELQSANEEVVSSNEELQSINEELETSKEEIESTNEELITTNQELQLRNEQLAESYAYSEAIIATIHEPLIILDKNLRVKSANQSFYRMFKVKEEETEGRLLYDLGNRQWDIPRLRELLEEVIPKNFHFHDFEIEHTFNEIGKKRVLLNAERIIQKSQREQLILVAMEDITERWQKQKEEKDIWFKDIADTAPVMIWVAGLDKQCTFFNRAWLEFTGRKIEQEIGNGWAEGVHKDDFENCLKIYSESFDERKEFTMEYRMRRYDGEYRWLTDSGKPRYDVGGKFVGYLGSCVDIHEQKMLKEELKKKVMERTVDLQFANKSLEISNSELQQFAYVASHDLQEPLRKIITFSNRVQEYYKLNKPHDIQLYLEKIVEASKRMTRMIDDLLNFSRSSRMDKSFIPTDLNQVVEDVLKDFDLIIKEKNAKLSIGKMPVIDAIPLQMSQLFHNLISNALKFSDTPGKVEITIASRACKTNELPENLPEGAYVEIVITDKGIGFDQEYANQIFIIFQRLHDKQTFPGTGIGLALCKKIVANHNGIITANSEPGKGAAFHVILPLKQM